jgi:hypothetical protein
MSIMFDGRTAEFAITVLHPHDVSITSEPFNSPSQPPFSQHTLWRVKANAVNPQFVVLLTAGASAAMRPTASANLGGGRMRVAVEFDGHPREHLALPDLYAPESAASEPTGL